MIKGKDLPWQQSRQGRSKYFLHLRAEDRAMQDWMLFQKDIMTESGAHTHQGGLVIYDEGRWTTACSTASSTTGSRVTS